MDKSLRSIIKANRKFLPLLGLLLSLAGVAVTTSRTGAYGKIDVASTPVPTDINVVVKEDSAHTEMKSRLFSSRGGVIGGSDSKAERSPDVANAIRNIAGCTANVLTANDDGSVGPIALPFSINYFGVNFVQTWVNNNGNITFGGGLPAFTPFSLNTTSIPIIAPFFADVDTRGTGSGLVRYGNVTVDGRTAFCVNWVGVGYFSAHVDKLNSFQLLLIQRSDTGTGNFDIEFNYNTLTWETGDLSGGVNGLGGSSARAGYANGSQQSGTFFELPGSAVNGALLDSNLSTGLTNNSSNSGGVVGRYVFNARNGAIPPPTPSVTVSVAPSSVPENGPNLVYTFTRTTSSGPLSVNFSTAGSTATNVIDYQLTGATLNGNSGVVTFNDASSTAVVVVDPIFDSLIEPQETVAVTVTPGSGYAVGQPNAAIGTVIDVPAPDCGVIPIEVGQTYTGMIRSSSCLVNGERTDLYSFNGTAAQRIALTMSSTSLFTRLELLNSQGAVLVTGGGISGVRDSRLPAADYFTLPAAGSYTVRAIGLQAGTGSYMLSLFGAPAQDCTFRLSPNRTDVSSTGGTFFFDVLTQPGCVPPAAPTAPSGAIYSVVSYVNGRVTFSVAANPAGGAARTDAIVIAGQTHTISQFAAVAPPNDLLANAQVVASPAPVAGSNTNATAEVGETAHAGNTASKSVWYSFTATASALYSFSTSGSNFDTVMAIYACPVSGGCTFGNFTLVGSNDDTTAFDRTSKINFRADAGRRYVIAVDGKNGATGTIQLSFMQYERLFRLYLQNYNGNPITIVPDSVRASNGQITINGALVSLGVYEFNLPVSTSPFVVTITGPTGIVWNPNNFPLDTSFRLLDELMNGPGTGGQNSTSNATCADGCSVVGFVRNVTEPDVMQGRIKVKIGYTRESTQSHRDEDDCLVAFRSDLGIGHARYQCLSYPQTNHDVVPVMAGKRFVEAVYAFSNPIGPMLEDIRTPRFIASDAQTFSISGRVLAGGEGTRVELTYTPPGGTAISRDVRTGANGVYEFRDLLPGTYQPRATREGFLFNTPNAVVLSAANATGVDITAQQACSYNVANPAEFSAGGGPGGFTVTTDAGCGWEARSEADWITVNSGVGTGTGTAQLTILPNLGPARTGMVRLRNRTEPVVITQANGCGFTLATPTQINFLATGGTGSVNVTATAAECGYTPTATDYCMITSLTAGGAGNGVVNFTVSANAGVARSTTISIGGRNFVLNQAAAPGTHRTRFDFDGDGRADLAVFRPSNGFWFVQSLGSTAFDNLPFGLPEDIPTAADFDGDGRTDIAVFRSSNQFWYRTNSSNGNFVAEQFAAVGDIPVPADYDGDGRDNIAVFRPSNGTWYTSTNPAINYGAVQFGISGDIPRPADYDGDGRADIAVYRPSNGVWYGIRSSNQQMFAVAFGTTGDMPVPADYDGDGRAELAVFRPSEGIWYRQNLTTGAFAATQWGQSGDLPVPADYNGDKFADLAVYRPSNGIWYVWSCTNNPLSAAQQFGVSTDKVIPFTNVP